VSEREQIDPDGIDFDFFDDAPTAEGLPDQAPSRRGPRMPQRPPGGNAPLLRLAALIAGGILLAVVLVVWVNSCRSDAKNAQYRDYMASVEKIGKDSAQVGTDLNQLIFSSGIQLEQLQTELDGLRETQSQTVARAEALDPPGALRQQQESLVEALQLRVSGLTGLGSAFGQITGAENNDEAGIRLAEQSARLIAGDVLWADFFKAQAQTVMEDQGVKGINVPDSVFVPNLELGSPTSWALVLDRLTGGGGGNTTGPRGNGIAGVLAMPSEKEFDKPPAENTVTVSDGLALEVLVKNSGSSQETQVKVTLTIQQAPEPLTADQTIQAINPGDTKSVTFKISDLGSLSYATRTIVKVTVEPVEGEANTSNNTAEYIVFFTLE
jgi:hypothetical protein